MYKNNIAGFMLGDNNLYYVDYSSSALNAISLNDGVSLEASEFSNIEVFEADLNEDGINDEEFSIISIL